MWENKDMITVCHSRLERAKEDLLLCKIGLSDYDCNTVGGFKLSEDLMTAFEIVSCCLAEVSEEIARHGW